MGRRRQGHCWHRHLRLSRRLHQHLRPSMRPQWPLSWSPRYDCPSVSMNPRNKNLSRVCAKCSLKAHLRGLKEQAFLRVYHMLNNNVWTSMRKNMLHAGIRICFCTRASSRRSCSRPSSSSTAAVGTSTCPTARRATHGCPGASAARARRGACARPAAECTAGHRPGAPAGGARACAGCPAIASWRRGAGTCACPGRQRLGAHLSTCSRSR